MHHSAVDVEENVAPGRMNAVVREFFIFYFDLEDTAASAMRISSILHFNYKN